MSTATDITSLAKELIQQSEALLTHIKTEIGHKQYEDSFIEKIQRLIASRQTIIDELQNEAARQNAELKTLVDAQIPKEDCTRLINMEKEISLGLKQILYNIQQSRKLLHDKQQSRKQYRNPFSSVARDGMFVDKRK